MLREPRTGVDGSPRKSPRQRNSWKMVRRQAKNRGWGMEARGGGPWEEGGPRVGRTGPKGAAAALQAWRSVSSEGSNTQHVNMNCAKVNLPSPREWGGRGRGGRGAGEVAGGETLLSPGLAAVTMRCLPTEGESS